MDYPIDLDTYHMDQIPVYVDCHVFNAHDRATTGAPMKLLTRIVVCCCTLYGTANSDTIQVPGNAGTIQAAVDMATDGDEIIVADGVYTGDGNRDIDFSGKAITIRSANGPEYTIIDCDSEGWSMNPHGGFYFKSGETSSSQLIGFTITRAGQGLIGNALVCAGSSPIVDSCRFLRNYGGPASGGAILITSGEPTFSNCWIAENGAFADGGVWQNGGTSVFQNCIFARNSGQGGSALGIHNATVVLNNCTLVENYGGGNYGAVFLYGPSHVEMNNTIVAFTENSAAVDYMDSATFVLSCCDLYGNEYGDWTDPIADQADSNGNFSSDPSFCDTATQDYHLQFGSPCESAGACGLVGALDAGCVGTECDDDPCATCGGTREGIHVRNTFLVKQDDYPTARWLSFDVSNKEPWIFVNGWKISTCEFGMLSSRATDPQTVRIVSADGNISNGQWVQIEVEYWLTAWNTVHLENVNWVRDGASTVRAAPAFGWSIGDPFVTKGDEVYHELTFYNSDPTDTLTFTDIWLKPSTETFDDITNVGAYTHSIPDVTLLPGDSTSFEVSETSISGDANSNGMVDVDDAVFLIAYIFSGGSEPFPYSSGDCNCSDFIDIDDIVYLVNYIFSGGPPPCESTPPEQRLASHIYGKFSIEVEPGVITVVNYLDHPVE